jgi:hypothetical protein
VIFYVLIAAFLGGLAVGGGGMYQWKAGQEARHEQEQRAAQDKIDALAAKAKQDAENKLVDMDAAFQAGEAQQKVITKTVYVKGQSYVAAAPQVFANPQCVLPDSSLQLINSEAASLRTAAAANVFGFGVPDTGGPAGRPNGNVVLSPPAKPATVEGVRPQVQPSGGTGQVPGSGVQRPPKPTPK